MKLLICQDQAPKKHIDCLLKCSCSQQSSGITRGLSWRGNLAERGPLSIEDLLVNTHKKTWEMMLNPGVDG